MSILLQYTYLNAHQIRAYVEHTYAGIYIHSGMVSCLHQHGFSYKLPIAVPAKFNLRLQKDFIHEYHRLKDSLPDDAVILFGDGVHPIMGTKLFAG